MKRSLALGSGAAATVFTAGCGTVAVVLSSASPGPGADGGASMGLDGIVGPAPDGGAPAEVDSAIEESATRDAAPPGEDARGTVTDGTVAPVCGACEGGMTCQNGQCACPAGQVSCGGACVDEQTDDANCGACGVACSADPPSAAACTAGRCLVTLTSGVGPFAVDATSVYWTGGGGSVMKMPTTGGATTTLAPAMPVTGQDTPGEIAVDTTNAYWIAGRGADPDSGLSLGATMKVPLAGGASTVLASGPIPSLAIAIDGTSVYFWRGVYMPMEANGIDVSLVKVPKDGGTAVVLTSSALASAATAPGELAVDATTVYVTSSDVMTVPTAGGTPTLLVGPDGLSQATSIALQGTNVYFARWVGLVYDGVIPPTSSSVLRVATTGGAPVALASYPNVLTATPIAVDATNVYWIMGGAAGAVVKVPIAGGTPATIASAQSYPQRIAVDATSVYWTTSGGTLMRLTPK